MTWQIPLIISIFGESFGRILQRVLLKDQKSEPIAYGIVSMFIGSIILSLYAFFQGFRLPPSSILPYVVLSPILWGTAQILIYSALKTTEASVFVVLFSTRVIWLIIIAILFFHESFTSTQIIGTALIMVSVLLLSYKKEQFSLKRGEVMTLIAGFVLAIAIINDSNIVKVFHVPSYLAISGFSSACFIWLVNYRLTDKIINIIKSRLVFPIGAMAFLYSTASAGYFTAYQIGNNAAQLGSLFQTTSIVTVFLAIVLLKERSKLFLKIAAAIISFIGVLLVK